MNRIVIIAPHNEVTHNIISSLPQSIKRYNTKGSIGGWLAEKSTKGVVFIGASTAIGDFDLSAATDRSLMRNKIIFHFGNTTVDPISLVDGSAQQGKHSINTSFEKLQAKGLIGYEDDVLFILGEKAEIFWSAFEAGVIGLSQGKTLASTVREIQVAYLSRIKDIVGVPRDEGQFTDLTTKYALIYNRYSLFFLGNPRAYIPPPCEIVLLTPEMARLPIHKTSVSEIEDLVKDPNRVLDLITQLRKGRILILGKYPGIGAVRIERIVQELKAKGLTPMVFGDLVSRDAVVDRGKVKEEVLTLAKLSEFVIVEDSEASGHLIELSDFGVNMVTTACLRRQGMGSTILTTSFYKKYSAFMREFSYTEINLASVLDDVLAWARTITGHDT